MPSFAEVHLITWFWCVEPIDLSDALLIICHSASTRTLGTTIRPTKTNPSPSACNPGTSSHINLDEYICCNDKTSRILSQSKLSVGIATLIACQDFSFRFLGLRRMSNGVRNNCYDEGGKDEEKYFDFIHRLCHHDHHHGAHFGKR
jgi:hypothetical protein